jgi:hypothetical protein
LTHFTKRSMSSSKKHLILMKELEEVFSDDSIS